MPVVFDLDGVLLDSESDLGWLWDALDAALESIGMAPTPEHRARLAPSNLRELRNVAEAWDVHPEELWRVRNHHYLEAKLSAIEDDAIGPFDDLGAIEALDASPHHIISNSPEAVVEAFVDRNGYDRLFDERLGRGNGLDSLERLKPDPYFYEVLVDATGRDTGYLYVGDSESDRVFAAATGMDYFHIDRTAGRGLWALKDWLE